MAKNKPTFAKDTYNCNSENIDDQFARCKTLSLACIEKTVNDYKNSLYENIKLIEAAETFFNSKWFDRLNQYNQYYGKGTYLQERCRKLTAYYKALENQNPKELLSHVDVKKINSIVNDLKEIGIDLHLYLRETYDLLQDFRRKTEGLTIQLNGWKTYKNGKKKQRTCCSYCKKEVRKTDKFCCHCGTKLLKEQKGEKNE